MDSVAPNTGTTVIEKDDILYSDGTTTLGGDDKVGIAAIIEALQTIKENNLPHGDIQVCFTVAEEIGCLGAKNLDTKDIIADYGYILDIGGAPGIVVNAAPAMLQIHVTVLGKAAHAGVEPEKGINAIMLAAKALAKLPQYGRIDDETTLNVGRFNGGVANNIVADKAEFVIDMRSMKNEKLEKLKNSTMAIIEEIVAENYGTCSFSISGDSPAFYIQEDSSAIKYAKSAAEKLNFDFAIEKTGGCSDGNFLATSGLSCILLATGMSNVHTTEEYLCKDDLFNCARWVIEIISQATVK